MVGHYATRDIEAAEALLLLRHRTAFRGRVLELGCGGGRLTGYLLELSDDVIATDLSPSMVEHCAAAHPRATVEVCDLREVSRFPAGSFDAVIAAFNVLDYLDHDDRLEVLADLRTLLTPDGVLVASSHNRAFIPKLHGPARLLSRDASVMYERARALPRRIANRRRLLSRQRFEEEYALVNDDAHDFQLLTYYVEPAAQRRQFTALGFEVLDCVTRDGQPVAPGDDAAHSGWIHYAATPARTEARAD